MKLGELKPVKGARKNTKRKGRGPGSGLGKTAGRGNKGSGQRSGYKQRPWFEGGQMPLARRLPKRGFSNHMFRKEFQIVNLSEIEKLGLETVTAEVLYEKGVVHSAYKPIKILGNGELTKAVNISASAFSKGALEKIKQAKGSATIL